MSAAPETHDPGNLDRVGVQFGLDGGSWIQRTVAAGIIYALGSQRVPRPRASNRQIAALRSKRIKSRAGYDVAYLESGDAKGRLVVFVHGSPGGAGGWADYLLGAPSGFRYLSIDRPGFGQSGPDDAVPSLAAQAAALTDVIRDQNAGPAIVVGHSFGGPVVVQAAADAPDLVAAVVVLAGSLDPSLEHVPFVQRIGDLWPVRKLLLRGLRNANRELIALKHELESLARRMPTIKTPFVIVHGTADRLVPFANVAFMKSNLTNAVAVEIIKLDGQDHFLPWGAKAEVDAAIARAANL